MGNLTSTSASNRTKWCCWSWYWCRCGCIVGGDVLINFVAWSYALIAPVRPILHQSSCSNKMVRNATKHEFGVQWGGLGAFLAKNSDATSFHEPMHWLHQFGPFCTEVLAVTKRSKTPQNISLGSNGVDRVRSLQKILTQLRCMNLCINRTSSDHFPPKFVL
jgi:hypothetical protein